MARRPQTLTSDQRAMLDAVTAARAARVKAEDDYRVAVAQAVSAGLPKSTVAQAAGVSPEAIRTVLLRMASDTPLTG